LFLGGVLTVLLYLHLQIGLAIYIGWLVFEGLTNWRLPVLLAKLRGQDPAEVSCSREKRPRINFDTERALRFSIASFLALSVFALPEILWFFPWFMAIALMMAGITGICPMAMLFRKLGFK
jgi:archaellum biogenesis protein FlaJ (TadC family)